VALNFFSAALSAFDNSKLNAIQLITLGQLGELNLIMTEDWNDRI